MTMRSRLTEPPFSFAGGGLPVGCMDDDLSRLDGFGHVRLCGFGVKPGDYATARGNVAAAHAPRSSIGRLIKRPFLMPEYRAFLGQ